MSGTGEMTIESGSVQGMNAAVGTGPVRNAIDRLAEMSAVVGIGPARNAIDRLAEMTLEKVANVAVEMMTSETPSAVGAEKKSAGIGVARTIVAVHLSETTNERRMKTGLVVPPRMAKVLPSRFRPLKMVQATVTDHHTMGETIGGETTTIIEAVTIVTVTNEGIEMTETGVAEKTSVVVVDGKKNGVAVGAVADLRQDLLGIMVQVALVLAHMGLVQAIDLHPRKVGGTITSEAVVVDTETIAETEIEIIGIGAGASSGEFSICFILHLRFTSLINY